MYSRLFKPTFFHSFSYLIPSFQACKDAYDHFEFNNFSLLKFQVLTLGLKLSIDLKSPHKFARVVIACISYLLLLTITLKLSHLKQYSVSMGREFGQGLTGFSASGFLQRLQTRPHWGRMCFPLPQWLLTRFTSLRSLGPKVSGPGSLLAGGHSQCFVSWASPAWHFALSEPARPTVASRKSQLFATESQKWCPVVFVLFIH